MTHNVIVTTYPWYRFLSVISLICLALTGCTSIRPNQAMIDAYPLDDSSFGYEAYARVLDTYVNEEGLVNYAALVKNPEDLDQFYHQIAKVSPDSHPHLFPMERDRLAYWINAYNSTVMKGVVEYYPIAGVADVKEPALFFFFPSKSGFFFFQRFTYGSKETSLYVLENSVIRDRFNDPRIHFALNCASSSCPKLPRQPFYPESLGQQLEAETYKFINSPDNVHYDYQGNVLSLSSIFDWYEDDFIAWIKKHSPEQEANLVNFITRYLPQETAQAIRERFDELTVVFMQYDWGLNDQDRKQVAGTHPVN